MTSKRDPWIKFFFADWRSETRLKMCSRAARSLWLDMLGLMHEAQPYGFLRVEGIAPTTAQLAYLVGDPERQVKGWLAELSQSGVFSVVGQPMPDDVRLLIPDGVPDGTMLSRRMLRDAAKRERDRVNGKGGGNPDLRRDGISGGLTPPDNPNDGKGVKPRRREGIRPRSQIPETRNPPDPPAAVVIPPPAHPGWRDLQGRALGIFGQQFCESWLFPAAIVPLSETEWALEARSGLALSRIKSESQRLHEFLNKSLKFRLAQGGEA